MNKCIMCGHEVHSDIGYVTDGKIYICAACEETHSLSRILTRIANSGIDSNLVEIFSQPVESECSLVNQTEEEPPVISEANGWAYITEYNEINDDIMNMSHEDFFSKYADNPDALHAYVDVNGESND